MPSTNTRFQQAIDTFCDQYGRRTRGPAAARLKLANAFRQTPFIYGTVGPNALRRDAQPQPNGLHNWQAGTGSVLARAVALLIQRARANPQAQGVAVQRDFDLYDPGARTIALVRNGYQMMDMYYGSANDLFRNRNEVIAEFVHYAMYFHRRGQRPAFDPNVSGRAAFMAAFNTLAEGWTNQHCTDVEYGQSATKEMSKIIRKGIAEFGGELIFEGQGVFGAGVFDPTAYQGDTDKEAQELLQYYVHPQTPHAPFGNGQITFHWGGVPTVPTRALFLTNWNFGGIAHARAMHSRWNRFNQDDPARPWREYVEKLMGAAHGLRPIWNNLANFPPNFAGQGHADFATMNHAIATMCVRLQERRH